MFRHLITFHGPSPFARDPVVVAGIDLPPEESSEAGFLREGCRCFHEAFPDWVSACPSPDTPLADCVGPTLAEWAKGALNEIRGCIRESGYAEAPGGAMVWTGFHHPLVSIAALETAWQLLLGASRNGVLSASAAHYRLESLWTFCREHHPDYLAGILMEGALSKDIPVMRFIPGSKYWQYGWGCRSRVFLESMSNADGSIGYSLQRSKPVGKEVFRALGFPVPPFELVSRQEDLAAAATKVGWPCVVKPLTQGGGKGVTAGITTEKELQSAFLSAKKFSEGPVMVEQHVQGDDHRLMVIEGRFFAAVRREPSSVTGDGTSTVRQLVAALNSGRSNNLVKSRYLRPVMLDDVLERFLATRGLGFDMIPEKGSRIALRSNANLTTGGICIDVSGSVHPDIKMMAESVADTMGISTAGIDFITTDIGTSFRECGALIEANTYPCLGVLIAAGRDTAEVACAVLGKEPGRIPFHLMIVGQQMLDEAAEELKNMTFREGTGLVCGTVTQLDGIKLQIHPEGPWPGIQALLRNRRVTQVIAVYSAEEIMTAGLPADRIDRVFLCGALPLIDEWMTVIGECSGNVIHTETITEALEAFHKP